MNTITEIDESDTMKTRTHTPLASARPEILYKSGGTWKSKVGRYLSHPFAWIAVIWVTMATMLVIEMLEK